MENSISKPVVEDGKKELEKYEIEEAARTLTKAEEIKSNSELYEAAKAHLAKQHKHVSNAMGEKPKSLEDLKGIAKKKAKEEIDEAADM